MSTTTSVSSAYTKCASDGGICSFQGSKSVAYAADDGSGSIYYRNLTNGTPCNSNVFGDPSPGHSKSCYIASLPQDFVTGGSSFYDSNGNPINWNKCANENDICNLGTGSPADILYGANGSYVYANASSVPCNSTVFGDPKPGVTKACYYRTSQTPSPTPSPTPTPTPSNGRVAVQRRTIIGLGVGLGITGFLLLIAIIIIIVILARKSPQAKAFQVLPSE